MADRVSSIPGPLPPASLIGRAAELERLRLAWGRSRSGERRMALLSGEPGIGKTRLAAEFAREVEAAGAIALYGRCDEDPLVPYAPFVHALKQLVAAGPPAPASLDSAPAMLPDLLRALAPEASLPDSPPPSDPATQRLVLFESVRSALRRAARSGSLLLVLDDLHWADRDTVRLLRYLAQGAWDAPLLLGAFRDTEFEPAHPPGPWSLSCMATE